MAWMACNLFVCCEEHDRVVNAVARLLQDAEHRADQAGLLDPPGPVLVSPALDGWVAVTGARGWLDDLVWAAGQLAEACDAAALSCEILGNSCRLRLSAHAPGQEVDTLQTPQHGWDLDTSEPDAMPLYEDAEALAFRRLIEAGVPHPLVTIGARPQGYGTPTQELGKAASLLPAEQDVERATQELCVVPFEGDDPPVLPTETSADFGLMMFEDRYLDGPPGDEAVDRLLEIERQLLARAKRAKPRADVTVTVTYHVGVHQDRMDLLLRTRNRHTLPADQLMRPPWWQFWRYFGRAR